MIAPPRILLIDDDRTWLETLAEYLRDHELYVETADDGRQGLALLEQEGVSLVLVDWRLPDLDGLDLLREILRRRRDLAVLLVSGDEDPALPARAQAAGARAVIPKTASPRFLLQAVKQALADAAVDRGGAVSHPPRRFFLPGPVLSRRMFPVVLWKGRA